MKVVSPPRHRSSGFGLIELLVTLVIIAILAAIALPTYQDFVRRGNQASAQGFLMDVASRANQFRLDTRRYPTGIGTGAGEIDLAIPDDVDKFYSLSLDADNAGTPPTLAVVATPKAGTMQAGMATLRLTSTGKKTPAEAWQ